MNEPIAQVMAYESLDAIYRDTRLTSQERREVVAAWRRIYECDLHGLYPAEIVRPIYEAIRRGYLLGAATVRIIHGHGFDRPSFTARFVNSNTGELGRAVRTFLRDRDSDLRRWMYAKFDSSDSGSTTVRIRQRVPAPTESRHAFDVSETSRQNVSLIAE